jgi:hypothetical protein
MVAVDIPVVATKSLPRRRHDIVISILADDNRVLTSGTVHVCQKQFHLPPNRGIALFPDKDGLLEDILSHGGARFTVVGSHYLKSGDFDLYDLVVFGTGCFEQYDALEMGREKIRNYLERGGTVLVLSQPDYWPLDFLPITLVTGAENTNRTAPVVGRRNHPLWKQPNAIPIDELLSLSREKYNSYPGVVFPGENLIWLEGGLSLLTVSRIGRGQLIYCGLPLLQMFPDLHPEAIDLFTNLVEFSR